MTRSTVACDCHVHVFGPRDRYPQIATRAYTAGLAPLDVLKSNATPLGIGRFVIVHASVHGSDNSSVLDAVDALAGNGRGVLVADPSTVTQSTLDDWSRRGGRGLRINLYSDYQKGAGPDRSALEHRFKALEDITPDEWHVEVIATIRVLASAANVLASSRVPVVIDHYGLPGEAAPESDHGKALRALMREPHVWMKLSGPYRAIEGGDSNPLSTTPPQAWVRSFLEAAPNRLVWGSDWPHTPPHQEARADDAPDRFRPIAYDKMFGDFVTAIGDAKTVEAILTSNPAKLYGWESV